MSGMVFAPPRRQNSVVLNITPLVDVLFLLIIFFTVAGTFKRTGALELRLPDSTTSTPVDAGTEEQEVQVVLTETGDLLLDGSHTERGELSARLRSMRAENPTRRVMIKAETGVRHGDVVGLLDIVREAGFPGVGIATLQALPSQPARPAS
ncbi:biopolymer transporter ExbD [Candidatus Fermentibacteria bacterium]|nr:biopolymer transporter ExbD [Candidatus Fermentibacteria bacterium]